jgi:uncharacterized protein YabN with tetrapyrrole methylase and pyrophosphatase domain
MPLFSEDLVIAGTGIRITGQLTLEAIAWMRRAEHLFYGVTDPVAEAVVRTLNPAAESLFRLYADGKARAQTYEEMVDAIMASVRQRRMTVAVFYGHPGVFAFPPHEAVRRARAEGFRARMLPAVSAEDCLFADLGVDPAEHGCLSLEATDFLLHRRTIDTSSQLVLWQVGVLGDPAYRQHGYDTSLIPVLVEKLLAHYPADHPAVVYEAAMLVGCEPRVTRVALSGLSEIAMTPISTLYLSPARPATPDLPYLTRVMFPLAR